MKAEKNRVTVFEQVSFQEAGTPRVVQSETRVSRELISDHDPMQRWVKVEKGWKPLDLGWLTYDGVDTLCILHKKREWPLKPSTGELREAESMVVEIGFCDSEGDLPKVDMLLRYGDSQRLCPNRPIQVRSPLGPVRVYVTAFPR